MRDLSATPMRREVLSWGLAGDHHRLGCQLEFDPAGNLHSLTAGGQQLIGGLAVLGVRRDGELHPWLPDTARLEADEVEARGRCAGLRLRVRHNLDFTWHLRITLTNDTEQPVALDGLVLHAAPGRDALLLVTPAGPCTQLGWHRLAPSDGVECLGMRLSRGDLIRAGDELRTPPLRLGPGEAYTLILHGDWYASSFELQQRQPDWFPPLLDLTAADDELELNDPDVALSWDSEDGPLRELTVAAAEGVTRLSVAFADEEAAYGRLVGAIQRRGLIAHAAEALALQRAELLQLISTDETTALLAEYAERTPDPADTRQVLVWLRMAATTGEAALVERAAAVLAELPVQPGYALAWLNLWVQQQLLGIEPSLGEAQRRIAEWLAQPGQDPLIIRELAQLLGPQQQRQPTIRRGSRVADLLCLLRPAEAWPAYADERLAQLVSIRALAEHEHTALLNRLLARAEASPGPLDSAAVLGWLALRD
ncbi:hypothetical protein [Enemella dayhoffiae]|uniref:hypothetical protein n=1 Tax=Enemella dayhoffiae TaxID=2016507 RepID=UPI0011407BD9|nr:hypothetical protein [Enemella dayhoffiae]